MTWNFHLVTWGRRIGGLSWQNDICRLQSKRSPLFLHSNLSHSLPVKKSAPPEVQPEDYPSAPLTDEMWESLNGIMVAIDNDDAFIASKIEGYIAGVLCCPVRLRTSEWFPAIWGSGQTIDSLGSMRMEIVVRLVMQHYNYVKSCLQDPESDYEPRYEVDTDGSLMWHIWAEGFDEAMHVGERGWFKLRKKILKSEDLAQIVRTLIGIVDTGMGGNLVPLQDRKELRESAPGLIPVLTKTLYAFNAGEDISMSQNPFGDMPDATPKVGRNDPCPCGSAKKFKKCHGG